MNPISFSGRVALVTGGGRGLDQVYCRELARRGAAVVLHDNGFGVDGEEHDPGPANDVAAAIVAEGGHAVTRGWNSETGAVSAEDVATHLDEITDTDELLVPGSIFRRDRGSAVMTARSIGTPDRQFAAP